MGEETFTVMVHIPYEGTYNAFSGTVDEIREWLLDCSYSRDDMELWSNAPVPDIYSL
jgi:hypothetical protein